MSESDISLPDIVLPPPEEEKVETFTVNLTAVYTATVRCKRSELADKIDAISMPENDEVEYLMDSKEPTLVEDQNGEVVEGYEP